MSEMKKIKILDHTVCGKKSVKPGAICEVPAAEARYMVGIKKAEYHKPEPIDGEKGQSGSGVQVSDVKPDDKAPRKRGPRKKGDTKAEIGADGKLKEHEADDAGSEAESESAAADAVDAQEGGEPSQQGDDAAKS